MTERRYYYSDDVQAEAQVLSCAPAEAGAAAELDATLFHPQGGGQPSDVGTLGGVAVLRCSKGIPCCTLPLPLPLGAGYDANR